MLPILNTLSPIFDISNGLSIFSMVGSSNEVFSFDDCEKPD